MALTRPLPDEPMPMPMPPLEDALAFADACELTSDEELHDFADVDIRDAFSPGKDLLMPELLAAHEPSVQPHAFFGADAALFIDGMSMQELHTVDLGQLAELQGKTADTSSKPGRRSSEPAAGAPQSNKFKRSRVKSTGSTRRDSQASARRQRASSSAVKAAVTTTAAAAASKAPADEEHNGTNPPVKKRIRRQREELLYLREKVKVLEHSLSGLRLDKASNGDSSTESTDSSPAEDDDSGDSARSAKIIADFEHRYKIESSSPSSADTQGSLWEGVANRQYGERERAEQENRHLKDALQRQIQLAKSLEDILQNEPTADLLSIPQEINSLKLLTSGESDQGDRNVVFKQLQSEVERAFRNFSTEVDEATIAAIRAEVDEVKVERCLQKGLAVKFSAHKRLPYSLQAVSNGMWRFFSFDGPRSEAYYCREHECSTENKLARSFGTKVQTGYATLDFRLRHVIERRAEPGRVVLVWRGVIKPIKFSGAPIHGIRFYERGWMIIEQPEGSNETTMTSSCSLSPLVDQVSVHQDVAIGALSDFVIESFHANALRCKEAAEGLMTEEEIAVTNDMIAL